MSSHVQDVASRSNSARSFSLGLYVLSFVSSATNILSPCVKTPIIDLPLWLCAFFSPPLNSLSFICPTFWFFPSHVCLLCLTLEESQQSSISAHNQAQTCLGVSAYLCTPVCAWGCDGGRPLSPSLISTSTVPVCWLPAIRTHTVPIHLL